MEEVHFDWRCIVCCMVALSPLHLEQQHLPGTESVYFDLDNTPWVKCDKCHTPFHLQCGTWESVYVVRFRRFLCTFFVVGSFNFSCPFYFVDLFIHFHFHVTWRWHGSLDVWTHRRTRRRSPNCPPRVTVVEARMRTRKLDFLKWLLWRSV